MSIQAQNDWTTTIMLFFKERRLSNNKVEAQKIYMRATCFVIINEVLYK